MNNGGDILAERTATNREFPERSLQIAVLGPNRDDLRSVGTRKRYQIRDALEDLGHRPFFPEDQVKGSLDWIGQERDLLRRDDVDLVIILHTADSFGALGEIANFVSVPEIMMKTGVFFPKRYYTPDKSLSANIVQSYSVKKPYTDEHMETCQLVSDCEKWARDMVNGHWPGLDRSAQAF